MSEAFLKFPSRSLPDTTPEECKIWRKKIDRAKVSLKMHDLIEHS